MIKKIAKYTGLGLLVLICLALLAYTAVYLHTEKKINKVYSYQADPITVPMDSATIARGQHLVQIRGCEDCHGKDLGGKVMIDDPMMIRITAPNITRGPGGLPAEYGTADWVRTMRHGVDKQGRSLYMMPSHELYKLTDTDLAAIIAFCRAAEPVASSGDKLHSLGPIGRVLLATDNVTILPAEKIDHRASAIEHQSEEIGASFGEYLATTCQGCHRENMEGGAPLAPGFPEVPDITARGNLHNWKVEQFITVMRTGVTPEGKTLDNDYMPWKTFSAFTDDELSSLYLYLESLPAAK